MTISRITRFVPTVKVFLAGLFAMAGACTAIAPLPDGPTIVETGDVDRFFALYDAAAGSPSANDLQDYIDQGSDGLRTLAKRRAVTGARIADALATRADIYANARECAQVLPAARRRLEHALRELSEIYPAARTPTVTIVVGRGRPVGIGDPATGVQISLEALCAAGFLNPDLEDRFVFVIAHEYVHVQQTAELSKRVEGANPTVLDVSLAEGIAEFVGELISGNVAYGSLRDETAGREDAIERAFLADKDSTDLSRWVYNSTPDQPGDLGYWVGYRIARAYYQRAANKRRAIADMLEMADPNAFLAASGWHPGMTYAER